jgi:hypothetical protein
MRDGDPGVGSSSGTQAGQPGRSGGTGDGPAGDESGAPRKFTLPYYVT